MGNVLVAVIFFQFRLEKKSFIHVRKNKYALFVRPDVHDYSLAVIVSSCVLYQKCECKTIVVNNGGVLSNVRHQHPSAQLLKILVASISCY